MISSQPNRQIVMAVNGPTIGLASIARPGGRNSIEEFPAAHGQGGRVAAPSSTVRRDPTVDDISTLLFVESSVPSPVRARGPRRSRV